MIAVLTWTPGLQLQRKGTPNTIVQWQFGWENSNRDRQQDSCVCPTNKSCCMVNFTAESGDTITMELTPNIDLFYLVLLLLL